VHDEATILGILHRGGDGFLQGFCWLWSCIIMPSWQSLQDLQPRGHMCAAAYRSSPLVAVVLCCSINISLRRSACRG
jgi:hypothetical protein